MDIILLIILIEFTAAYLYFTYAEIYFLLTIIFFLIYFVLKYYDGDEYTGFRSWTWLRKFTLFGKTTTVYLGNAALEERERMLFVVVGNLTNMGLIHGFGFHGGFFKNTDLVYMLPWILFKIPLLRDVLLWSGAISNYDAEGTILNLLKRGKSVVYCPSNMEDYVNFSNPRSDDPERVAVHAPSNALFEFAMVNKISIVPVMITNETLRYRFMRSHLLHRIHKFIYPYIGWPFPFLFMPRIFNEKQIEKLNIQIGTPMDGTFHSSVEAFSKMFMGSFVGLAEVGGDSKELLIQ
jgi:hypothetical protein